MQEALNVPYYTGGQISITISALCHYLHRRDLVPSVTNSSLYTVGIFFHLVNSYPHPNGDRRLKASI